MKNKLFRLLFSPLAEQIVGMVEHAGFAAESARTHRFAGRSVPLIESAVIFLHIVIFHLREIAHFANIKRRDKRIFAIALKYVFENRKHKFAFEALFDFWHKLKRLDKAKIVKIVRKCKRIIK